MSVAMGRIAAAVVLAAGAVFAVLVVARGGDPLRDPHGPGEATAYAEALLDREPLPKGAAPFTGTLPSELTEPALDVPAEMGNLVELHRVYRLAETPATAFLEGRAHGVPGFSWNSWGGAGPNNGGLTTIGEMQGWVRPLATTRQVIAVEMQGHGRTADTNRPMTFRTMGDDIAALLDYLKIPKADQHPHKVRRLVVISSPSARAGWYPEARNGMSAETTSPRSRARRRVSNISCEAMPCSPADLLPPRRAVLTVPTNATPWHGSTPSRTHIRSDRLVAVPTNRPSDDCASR